MLYQLGGVSEFYQGRGEGACDADLHEPEDQQPGDRTGGAAVLSGQPDGGADCRRKSVLRSGKKTGGVLRPIRLYGTKRKSGIYSGTEVGLRPIRGSAAFTLSPALCRPKRQSPHQ